MPRDKVAHLSGPERARYVRDMFARISPRYDLMNRLMTAGQDVRWRREVIRRVDLPQRGRILDLGAGTGDLALEALKQNPQCRCVAADFTIEMMRIGQSREGAAAVCWTAADALRLPYPTNTFDGLVSGFLLRNVVNLEEALREQHRVLKPGGRLVALDTTRPRESVLSPLINLHLHYIIPTLGRILTGEKDAYRYLPDSTESFLGAEKLAANLVVAGFRQVGFHTAMFGTVAIHWGTK